MHALWLALAFAFVFAQNDGPSPDQLVRARQQAAFARQRAIRLNELLGNIRSEADAQTIVDSVAKMFEKELPPAWATRDVRQRVARAEYEAVTDHSRLIPEQRMADVWNEYVRQIGAPDEALVTKAEIHSLRDGQYAGGMQLWTLGINQSVWTMPNIAAIGPDGRVADGCRALEAIEVFFTMSRTMDNIRSARENVKKGIVVSDRIKKEMENHPPPERSFTTTKLSIGTDPFHPAEQRYVSEHGVAAFDRLLEALLNQLFPEQ